jgi:two-component system, OmpR family, response regulator MprA
MGARPAQIDGNCDPTALGEASGSQPSTTPAPIQEPFRLDRHTTRVRVLVVDDEPAVRNALERALSLDGYEVQLAADGEECLFAVRQYEPELVVLDVLMPGLDGLSVCRQLRRDGRRTPILMLTARDLVADRVAGLDAGADDYLVKPFALEELLARVRALLRRSLNGDPHGVLRFADLVFDPATREVTRGERKIELTQTEYLLLELFLLNPRQVLPRPLIFDRVWGYDFGPTSNSLEVYVGYLRKKLEAAGEPRLIRTVRGTGYALQEP